MAILPTGKPLTFSKWEEVDDYFLRLMNSKQRIDIVKEFLKQSFKTSERIMTWRPVRRLLQVQVRDRGVLELWHCAWRESRQNCELLRKEEQSGGVNRWESAEPLFWLELVMLGSASFAVTEKEGRKTFLRELKCTEWLRNVSKMRSRRHSHIH